MRFNRKIVALATVIGALAAGGIAYAVGSGDSEERVTGPDADKAKAAALDAAGGGKVTEVERQDGDGGGAFEVEVQRPDGSQVEVHINGQYQPVGTASDDDNGAGSDDDAGEGED